MLTANTRSTMFASVKEKILSTVKLAKDPSEVLAKSFRKRTQKSRSVYEIHQLVNRKRQVIRLPLARRWQKQSVAKEASTF